MSRTKLAFRNIYSNIILQITIAVCGFIVPPLIIAAFGSEINGLVSTIKQLMNYFSIVSLGIGASTAAALYKPLAQKNYKQVSAIFAATRIFFNQTGYWFGGLVLITIIVLPCFKAGAISPQTISLLVLILGSSSFLEYILTVKYRLLLQADQRNYIGARISAEGSILNTLVIILLIKLGANIVWVQLAASGMYLYRLLGLIHWVKKLYPTLNPYAPPDFQAISSRWHAFQYQLPNIIISYTPILIIAAFCGYAEASIYAVYNTIFAALSMILGIFSVSLAPTFGNIIAEGNLSLLNKNYRMYETFYHLLLAICCISASILVLPFVSLYIHTSDGSNYLIPAIAVCFSFQTFCSALRTPCVTLVNAKGLFKENKRGNLYEALANILLAVLFIEKWGIASVLVAGAITAGIRSLSYIRHIERIMSDAQFCNQLFLLFLYGVYGIVCYCLFSNFTVSNWIEWIWQAVLRTTGVGIGLFLITYLFRRSNIQWGIKKIIGRIFPRKIHNV